MPCLGFWPYALCRVLAACLAGLQFCGSWHCHLCLDSGLICLLFCGMLLKAGVILVLSACCFVACCAKQATSCGLAFFCIAVCSVMTCYVTQVGVKLYGHSGRL